MYARTDQVFVTGCAASTCCGVGVAPLFARFRRGLSSDSAPPTNPCSANRQGFRFPPITVDISQYVRITRTENELTRQLLAAVASDLAQKVQGLSASERDEMGIILGNTSGNYTPYCQFYSTGINDGYIRVNPAHLPATLINYQAVQLSNALGIMGQSTTISSGFSAGLDAVGHAMMRLRLGKDRAILAGGIQELTPYDHEFLQVKQLISPRGVIRPYHGTRDGTVPAEAVALLLLERQHPDDGQHCKALAEVLGWASATGGPGKDPVARAKRVIDEALRMAELEAGEVDAIFPSANGTCAGDQLEIYVLRRVFGDRLSSVAVYPIKSVVGECLAASGPLQCIAALYAMNHGADPSPYRVKARSNALHPVRRLASCIHALVLCVGLDHSCSAMVLAKA